MGLKDIIYAKRHNKTLKEVYCQKLIQKEQLHYLSKNHNQKRLERNCYKYKKNKKNRYKRRMGRRGEKFVSRMEYLDLLYNTSRTINNKSIRKYKQVENKQIKHIKAQSIKKHKRSFNDKPEQKYQRTKNKSITKKDEKLERNLTDANTELEEQIKKRYRIVS